MNTEEYLREVTPVRVLDLVDPDVLYNFLNGYSYALEGSLVLVHPADQSVVPRDGLHRLDALEGASRVDLPLCAYWRAEDGCNMKPFCYRADELEALRYFDGEWERPRLYRCRSLDLWDMAYPLVIDSRIIGVLLCGQVMVSGGAIDWRDALRDYSEYVDWETCLDQDVQSEGVRKRITAHANSGRISEEQENELLRIVDDELSQDRGATVEYLKGRFESFLRFGEMTQGLVDELYAVRRVAAEQQLIHTCDEQLDAIDLADEELWWAECGRVLRNVTGLPGIEDIHLYVRERSRYYRKIPSADSQAPQRIAARDIVPMFPAGHLVAVPDTDGEDSQLDLGDGRVWGYRSQTGVGSEVCSTLVVLQGEIPEARHSLMASLCGNVCTATDIAHLIFRERNVDLKYRHDVSLIGHSFRSPLQALQFLLEDLGKAPAVSGSPRLSEKIASGARRIQDAGEDLLLLLEPATQKQETFELVEILDYVLDSMKPFAKQHPCSIVKLGNWPERTPVRGIRHKVQRALTCLVDNAIKYSFHGRRRGTQKLYEVRVEVTIKDEYIVTTIVNYGIGIPEDKLLAIREYGVRGGVVDRKKTRLGTGLGLPFAIDVFEEYGGWLHLTSVPAGSATNAEIKKHHRYVTVVEVALPITRRRN